MQFRILGEVQVLADDGTDVVLGGRKPRAVLAVLLLNANKSVQTERLAHALWGDDAQSDSIRTVQVHVSRLRKALGDGKRIGSTPSGYLLRVEPGELDLARFERLVDDARDALAAGNADRAASVLREADALWRGPPLADVAFEPFAAEEIARLEERRLLALELRLDAELAAGRHADVVSDLRHLVAEYPAREHLAAQLMLALYRCGRQSEALDTFQATRRKLSDGIGVDPGSELRAMQTAVLQHDPGLDLPIASELPRELETAAAGQLVGREADLQTLRTCWMAAQDDRGRLVVLAGEAGMGKTRLAAELACEVQRAGATVIYAPGGPPPATAFAAALAAARTARRPVLVVADDADRVPVSALDDVRKTVGAGALVLVLAANQQTLVGLGTPDAMVPLTGLGSDGVGAIVSLYQPERQGEGMPIERLLVETRGVPSRVHEEASRWARLEAAERVGAVAERRSELRSMEAELTDRVAQLQSAGEWAPPADGDGSQVVCPFKGLASFDADDAPYFFGRDRLIARLVAGLAGATLLGIVGPSGSGKSSVLRAGLLPRLASGVLPSSDQWGQVVMRPGAHPRRELQAALRRASAGRLVLAVDQFEETFTVCRDEEERSQFIADIVRACEREPHAVVVLALRADFYGSCAEYPALARLLAANNVLVRPMRHDELRQAVIRPAERAGLEVEPELADVIVRDVEGRPGALPLMSTALLELWERRDGRTLRYATYEQTGGVTGAVGRLAEDAFSRLDEQQQVLARRVLLRLAEVEPEGGVERRRLPIADLDEGTGTVVGVIDLLADARLLTVSEGSVEFAHEALMREWPRLSDWIDDNRDDLNLHRRVKAARDDWELLDRDPEQLLRGARLVEAREWAGRADPGPTADEQAFLTASADRERRARRGHRRRLAIAFGALAVGIVVIAIVALVAIGERRDAEDARNVAVSQELALQAGKTVAVDPEVAVRLALMAGETAATPDAAEALREATLAFRGVAVLDADSLDAFSAAYSPDGTRVVTGGTDGKAIVWDARTHRQLATWNAGHGPLHSARYSPSGDTIALGFHDGTVATTDASLADPHTRLRVRDTSVLAVRFSGDGARIAAGMGDGTVRVFGAAGGGNSYTLEGNTKEVNGVDISADGTRVAGAGEDGSVRVWSLEHPDAPTILRDGGQAQNDVAFNPDGDVIASVGADGWVRLWEGGNETRIRGEGRQLWAVAFSADGQKLAAGASDGVTRIWSVVGGPPLAVLRGQRSRIYDVGFGPRSDQVVSAADDGTVRLWDAGNNQAWAIPSKTYGISFGHDGQRIASSSDDGTVRVGHRHGSARGQPAWHPRIHVGQVLADREHAGHRQLRRRQRADLARGSARPDRRAAAEGAWHELGELRRHREADRLRRGSRRRCRGQGSPVWPRGEARAHAQGRVGGRVHARRQTHRRRAGSRSDDLEPRPPRAT